MINFICIFSTTDRQNSAYAIPFVCLLVHISKIFNCSFTQFLSRHKENSLQTCTIDMSGDDILKAAIHIEP